MNNTTSPQVEIVIGAAPTSSLDLSTELRLTKAALLYADSVTLYSISTSMASMMELITDVGEDELMDILIGASSALGNDPLLISQYFAEYKRLSRKKYRSRDELIRFKKIEAQIKKTQANLAGVAQNLIDQSNSQGLATAIESGLVNLHFFDVNSDNVVQEYYDLIADAVVKGHSYPLLDDATGDLINSAMREGELEPGELSVRRARQVGLSSELFERLPVFEKATVDEVLEIRAVLIDPLIRFRSAISKFSKDIDGTPWDESFPLEVDELYIEEVAPAILEIEEALRTNRPLVNLIKK